MLVITRRQNETIVVDGPCTIEFLGFHHGKKQIKLGITGPARVYREETLTDDQKADVAELMNKEL